MGMATFEFTLRLDQEVDEAHADALYEVFGDGSIMTGSGGTEIEFIREADGWAEAIISAVRDVESVPGLRVTGAGQEDLVSLLDIAHRARRSREAVRLWATGKRGPGGFPTPKWRSPSGERFWSWPDVAWWIAKHLHLAVEVTPEPIRMADGVLKARQAVADAQRILGEADDPTREQLSGLFGAPDLNGGRTARPSPGP
jgi:hypothetical protein